MGNAVSGHVGRGECSPWHPLELSLSAHVLAETLDGGQSFRWNRSPEGIWRGIWGPHVAEIRHTSQDRIEWRAIGGSVDVETLLTYIGDDSREETLMDQLPWRSDAVLKEAIDAFPGLRILRQPLGEALLGFLCSSTKQIVQIKAMMELLAERFGERLPSGDYALPDWATLAGVDEAPLRACKLGFRARYVAKTAQLLAAEPGWETRLTALSFEEAHQWLCRLPGVGAKVADCVLLFGAGRLEAFPVDTWILKILTQAYGLSGWTPAQLATFGKAHFGPGAGLAQQYLFAWARQKRRSVG